MSEVANIIAASVSDRAPRTADPVKNLTTGATFTAEIEGNLDPFTIPQSLGDDPRAKIRLHVESDDQADEISMGDLVSFTLYGKKTTARIVHRDLDPASPQTKFLAAQVLGKDAQ